MLNQPEHDDLETLIDARGLPAILDALATICHGKADHLRSTWQDNSAAASWVRAAKAINKAEAVAAMQLSS